MKTKPAYFVITLCLFLMIVIAGCGNGDSDGIKVTKNSDFNLTSIAVTAGKSTISQGATIQ